MIRRLLEQQVLDNLTKFPIVAIVGPRQSGKTTLARMIKPDYQYVNLELPSERLFAQEDPIGFLKNYQGGVIIDEVQHAPELFSYLQVMTDDRKVKGEYILTGSQHFMLMEQITQSLAGRVAIFQLLPLCRQELMGTAYLYDAWEDDLLHGFYPRLRIDAIDPSIFFDSYLNTYVERDVRMIKNISNLDLFQKFLRLLAGRVGQLFNQSSLAIELGIDHKTVNAWMSVLESSFITFRLKPYFENFSKRMIKSPKIYFYDVGLLSHLLGIKTPSQLQQHFALGGLYENLIIMELYKLVLAQGVRPEFYFWRDVAGHEVDLIIPTANMLKAIEIKSSQTIHADFFKNLSYFSTKIPEKYQIEMHLVYGGEGMQRRSNVSIMNYGTVHKILE